MNKEFFIQNNCLRRTLLRTVVTFLFIMFLMPLGVKATIVPLAKLTGSGNDCTLTFTYADNSIINGVDAFNLPIITTEVPHWITNGKNLKVKKVVFAEDFANARPLTTARWFAGMENLTRIEGIQYLNTSEVTSMFMMFNRCISLESVNLRKFNTEKVNRMENMFERCQSLKSLDLSSFNTSEVTTMFAMFKDCNSLTSINVSSFDTQKTGNMANMFTGCSKLTSIDISNFSFEDCGTIANMFDGDSLLTKIYLGSNDFKILDNEQKKEDVFKKVGALTPATLIITDDFDTSVLGTQASDGTYSWLSGKFKIQTEQKVPVAKISGNTETGRTLTFTYDCEHRVSSNIIQIPSTLNTSQRRPSWYTVAASVKKVIFEPAFADARPVTMDSWFEGMTSLTTIEGMENLNTSETKDMKYLFNGCTALDSINLSGFNTSNVFYMQRMFKDCSALKNLDVSGFNTSKASSMEEMFYGCSNITTLKVDSFETMWVTDMEGMFYGCSKIDSLNLSGFNIGGYLAITAKNLLYGCTGLKFLNMGNNDLSNLGFDSKENAFYGIGNPDAATLMIGNDFEMSELGAPDTDGVYTWMEGRFKLATKVPVAKLSGSEDSLTLTFTKDYDNNINGVNVMNITTTTTNRKLPGWNSVSTRIKKVVFDSVFADVRPLSTASWFNGMKSLKTIEGMKNLNTSETKDMRYMFADCAALDSLDLSFLKTDSVVDMQNMFYGCNNMTTIDVSHFNTGQVEKMMYMFSLCRNLVSLDVSHFNTSKVDNMNSMFAYCGSLKAIDVSHFNTSGVIDMNCLFYSCKSLDSLDVSNFVVNENATYQAILYGCSALRVLNVGNTDFSELSETSLDKAFKGVGRNEPATLIVGEDFDVTKLGTPSADGVYTWMEGRFKVQYPAGIGRIGFDRTDSDAPRYDLQGRRVGKDYKGIVIQNGKKLFSNK